MRTGCGIFIVVAGCGFAPGDFGDDTFVEIPDTQVEPKQLCNLADPSLRLCVDFEGTLGTVIADRSANAVNAAATAVVGMPRQGEQAAALTLDSTMHVSEAMKLDIEAAIAIDMWIKPVGLPIGANKFWMLDNNGQYGASFTEDGKVRCFIRDRITDSDVLVADGEFHHIACTYDGTTLKVFVDGSVSRCTNQSIAIPITGDDGLAIGANLSGSNTDPDFSEQFVGGLDNLRVWARSDLDVCAAANKTGCTTVCP